MKLIPVPAYTAQSAQFGRKATAEEFKEIAKFAKETWGLEADPRATTVTAELPFMKIVRRPWGIVKDLLELVVEVKLDQLRYRWEVFKDASLREKYQFRLRTDISDPEWTKQAYEKKKSDSLNVRDIKVEPFGPDKLLVAELKSTEPRT